MEKTKITITVDMVSCKFSAYRTDNHVQLGPRHGFRSINAIVGWLRKNKDYVVNNTVWRFEQ